jgi:hypothetical protein
MEQEKKQELLEEQSPKDGEAPKKIISLSADISCEGELAVGKEKVDVQR